MAERALAHIEKVVKTYEIEKADKVEMVQVMDFHVVAKKGEFKEGELVVYVEVDAILPDGLTPDQAALLKTLTKKRDKATGEDIAKATAEVDAVLALNTRPEFEFLRTKKFRIKALQYKSIGVISMGIIFPTSILPAGIEAVEGLDVTADLGIVKFIEDVEEANTTEVEYEDVRSDFEKFLDEKFMRYSKYRELKYMIKGQARSGKWDEWIGPKTDTENIQKVFTRLKGRYGDRKVWQATSKLEGQSMSVYNHIVPTMFGFRNRVDFGVCSKNVHMVRDDGGRFWKTAKELDLEKRLKATHLNITVQGEHVGPRIQSNIYGLSGYDFYLFSIWDIDRKTRYSREQFMDFCLNFNFKHVPVIEERIALPDTVQEILAMSNRMDMLMPGIEVASEGMVLWNWEDPNEYVKVKSQEYAILHGK